MKISIKVKPNARQEKIEQAGDILKVYVKEPPQDNKANRAVIRLLSEHFKTPKSRIFIIKGMKSKQKIIEIKKG